jgi:hypothetical protein
MTFWQMVRSPNIVRRSIGIEHSNLCNQ